MKRLLTLLLFSAAQTFAQQVYLPHEVEKQAEPAGGLTVLNQFISSNLQIPFQNSVKGVNGRVYLKGVVQPDGTMSNIEVTRGIDTLCNAAAVKVLEMYRAWRPATLKGEKVRQTVFFPVGFQAKAKPAYNPAIHAFVEYYDGSFNEVSDSTTAKYRRILPVDARGFVAGDISYAESRGKKWKPIGDAKFTRKPMTYKSRFVNPGKDSIMAFRVSARDFNEASHAPEATFHEDGRILSYTEYELHGKASMIKDYDLNGMVRRQQILGDSAIRDVSWDANGQIRSHIEIPIGRMGEPKDPFMLDSWGPDGVQYVKEGDGYWRAISETPDGRIFFEQGRVVGGRKDGKWVGKFADSTQFYEESYDKGFLNIGTALIDGQKVDYTNAIVNPAFKGGMQEFYRFLGMNIKFPVDAARNRVGGRVMLSFVVCEDGTLCEYKVENRLGYGLEEEALRVAKLMDGKWKPGELRGQKVKVRYNVPINFQFE